MIKIIKISMRGQQAPNKGSEKKIKNEITEEQKREIKKIAKVKKRNRKIVLIKKTAMFKMQ